jgi:hypothetical protein
MTASTRHPGSKRYWLRWSVPAIVEELRRIDGAGRVRMTSNALAAAGRGGLVSAISNHIGSFGRALKLAGIPHPCKRWPDPGKERGSAHRRDSRPPSPRAPAGAQ